MLVYKEQTLSAFYGRGTSNVSWLGRRDEKWSLCYSIHALNIINIPIMMCIVGVFEFSSGKISTILNSSTHNQ